MFDRWVRFFIFILAENLIASRDLVAFAAESADDVNLLLEQFRPQSKGNEFFLSALLTKNHSAAISR